LRGGVEQDSDYIAIFSSTEGEDVAGRLGDAFGREGRTARHWRDFVKPGRSFMESVTSVAAGAAAVVVVATPDMETTRGEVVAQSPVPNVLFELGVAIASVGLERTFLVRPTDRRMALPSDLDGFPWVPYDPGSSREDLRRALGACAREIVDLIGGSASKMSWDTYFRHVQELAERTVLTKRKPGFPPHGIIAVNPGGAIVGGRLYFMSPSRALHLTGLFPREQSHELMCAITRQLVEDVRPKRGTTRILAVDASIKTGQSMHEALCAIRDVLSDEGDVQMKTAVLVDVPDEREADYPVDPEIVITRDARQFPYGDV
jgi:hypoxanthine phosphoribosyltransferase